MGVHLTYGRASMHLIYERASNTWYGCASHIWACILHIGVHLTGMGVHLTGVHLIGVLLEVDAHV